MVRREGQPGHPPAVPRGVRRVLGLARSTAGAHADADAGLGLGVMRRVGALARVVRPHGRLPGRQAGRIEEEDARPDCGQGMAAVGRGSALRRAGARRCGRGCSSGPFLCGHSVCRSERFRDVRRGVPPAHERHEKESLLRFPSPGLRPALRDLQLLRSKPGLAGLAPRVGPASPHRAQGFHVQVGVAQSWLGRSSESAARPGEAQLDGHYPDRLGRAGVAGQRRLRFAGARFRDFSRVRRQAQRLEEHEDVGVANPQGRVRLPGDSDGSQSMSSQPRGRRPSRGRGGRDRRGHSGCDRALGGCDCALSEIRGRELSFHDFRESAQSLPPPPWFYRGMPRSRQG